MGNSAAISSQITAGTGNHREFEYAPFRGSHSCEFWYSTG